MKLLLSIVSMFFCLSCWSQSHNFSYKIGLASIWGSSLNTETVNYFTLEVDATHPLNFYPVHGIQYEYRPKKVKRLGFNSEIMTHENWIFPWVSDTHPNLPFSVGGRYLHFFRHLTLSSGPSIHFGRHIKVMCGMDLSYMFRVGTRGYDWQSQSPNPDPDDRRLGEMADAMYRHLKVNPFSVNSFAALEVRFWRMGLEARVAEPMTGNMLKAMEIDGYRWDTRYFVNNIYMLTTKIYLRKI